MAIRQIASLLAPTWNSTSPTRPPSMHFLQPRRLIRSTWPQPRWEASTPTIPTRQSLSTATSWSRPMLSTRHFDTAYKNCYFSDPAASTPSWPRNQCAKTRCSLALWRPPMSPTPSLRSQASSSAKATTASMAKATGWITVASCLPTSTARAITITRRTLMSYRRLPTSAARCELRAFLLVS